MGCIISISEAIDATRFTKLKKGKIYKGCEIILLEGAKDRPDVALVKMPNQELTVLGSRHLPNGNWAVMRYGVTHFDKSVLKAMVAMGVVSQTDIDKHIARVEDVAKKKDIAWAKESLASACKTLGIPVPEIPE